MEPRKEAAQFATMPGQREHAEGKTHPLRVLIADDNRDAADSTAMVIRHWGHHVLVAYDGTAALRMAIRDLPDLILLDIGMPGKNGYEVAQAVRRQPSLQETALVAISAYSGKEHSLLCERAGFDLALVKPVEFGLLEEVCTTVERARTLLAQSPEGRALERCRQARQLLGQLRESLRKGGR